MIFTFHYVFGKAIHISVYTYKLCKFSDLTLLLDKDPDYYFTEEDRAGMISDILTLAMVNKTSISDAFRMIR